LIRKTKLKQATASSEKEGAVFVVLPLKEEFQSPRKVSTFFAPGKNHRPRFIALF